MPKGVVEKLLAEYDVIRNEADGGRRLLALRRLEEKIAETKENPQHKPEPDVGFTLFKWQAGAGALLGIGMGATGKMDFVDANIVGDIVGSTLFHTIAGAFSSVISYAGFGERLTNKIRNREIKKYINEVLPNMPALDGLEKAVASDMKAMFEPDAVLTLQQSPVLEKVIAVYPDVVHAFRRAHEKEQASSCARQNKPSQGFNL